METKKKHMSIKEELNTNRNMGVSSGETPNPENPSVDAYAKALSLPQTILHSNGDNVNRRNRLIGLVMDEDAVAHTSEKHVSDT